MAQAAAPARDFKFFVEIIDAYKSAAASAPNGDVKRMEVGPFLEAMTMFLRIFDAFSNPFFSDVVKKDVQGNINVSNAPIRHTSFFTSNLFPMCTETSRRSLESWEDDA